MITSVDLKEARWATAGAPLSPSTIAAMRGHPSFPVAARRSAQGIIDVYDGNRLLNSLLGDRGRTVFGLLALHLHFHSDDTGSGLTTTRMAQICEESDVCSRGRTKALLALLSWAGYLSPVPDGADRRQRRLVPTERMLRLQTDRWRWQFESIALVAPEGTEVLERLGDPGFVGRLASVVGLAFRAGFRVLDYCPVLKPFAEQNSGLVLLLTLALSGPPDGPMPPVTPVDLSISKLARRFHVSRAHVLQILRNAEEQGLLIRSGPQQAQVTCLPPLREALENFLAGALTALAVCARQAMAEGAEESHARPGLDHDHLPAVPVGS